MSFQYVIYFCLIFGVGVSAKYARVIGGVKADIKDFPYMASLRYKKQNILFCGGAIISKWHVLTAAHCLYDRQSKYNQIKIYTGTSSSSSKFGSSYDIATVFYHPMYKKEIDKDIMEHHDIAVIMITTVIHYNEFQKKVNLPTIPYLEDYVAVLTGWGMTSINSKIYAEELQKIPMYIYDNSICSKYVPFILQDEQLCAYYNQNVGACTGDSGSPLVINGEIVGIVSFAFECAHGFPDIYTKVYSYLNFIKDVLRIKFAKCLYAKCPID